MLNRPSMDYCVAVLFLCLAGHDVAAADFPGTQAPKPNGVVVEEVEEGFAAHKAGLQPGDVLLRWQRAAAPPANPGAASGDLSSPFDLDEVETEQAPRGDLTVSGTRGEERLLVRLPPGNWRLRTRPQLTESQLEAYEEAKALVNQEEVDEGLSRWEEMASIFGGGGDPVKASWLSPQSRRHRQHHSRLEGRGCGLRKGTAPSQG